jgi:hypothetical protein
MTSVGALASISFAKLDYIVFSLLSCRKKPKTRKSWHNWSCHMANEITSKFIQHYQTSANAIGVV